MVRTKHRYLLVQILDPSATTVPSQSISSTFATITQAHPSTSERNPPPLHIYTPTPDAITPAHIIRLIRLHIKLLFGDYGMATAGGPALKILYWSNATSTFIVRSRREAVRILWAALTFINTLPIPDPKSSRSERGMPSEKDKVKNVVLRVVRCSGTIRKCEEEAIARAKSLVGRVEGGHWVERFVGVGSGRDGDESEGGEEEDVEDDEDEDMEDG